MNQDIEVNLYEHTLACLLIDDPVQKVTACQSLQQAWQRNELDAQDTGNVERLTVPGRPARPRLVAPRQLAKRSAYTQEGKAALIHAICHIEFNAINLALDAVYRFRGLPHAYYSDWLKVAAEEAHHFSLLAAHLKQLGYAYGDFDAHNGLWEMAVQTDHDVLVRMALVPRVMEARGLDVTPSIMEKLENAGDTEAVDILKVIQRDEVGHVEIGTHWFNYFCRQRNLIPLDTFTNLLNQYMKGELRGPFDLVMRKKAGFTDDELAYLTQAG